MAPWLNMVGAPIRQAARADDAGFQGESLMPERGYPSEETNRTMWLRTE